MHAADTHRTINAVFRMEQTKLIASLVRMTRERKLSLTRAEQCEKELR